LPAHEVAPSIFVIGAVLCVGVDAAMAASPFDPPVPAYVPEAPDSGITWLVTLNKVSEPKYGEGNTAPTLALPAPTMRNVATAIDVFMENPLWQVEN
jgi:hypothetical protein